MDDEAFAELEASTSLEDLAEIGTTGNADVDAFYRRKRSGVNYVPPEIAAVMDSIPEWTPPNRAAVPPPVVSVRGR